ncbi:hypothetical protein [Clostridium botulinum]|uniref:Uncharacterized protein n=1 Tax=Clostridium botulinum (strain Langeland / NCTC 10281 / Type F) TaxID=441772 RepID=A7GEG5_CLOBL|nr:hypothetical protein [Clostridium botulinum]ABS40034.1 conserved hypothetical protein [Clostridium botulinum F str. Langeland]KKM42830.1 hypothetical protein VT72_04100 [Clostridium botulinum]
MRNRNVMILNVQAKDVIDGGYIVDKTIKKDIDKLYEEEKRIFSKYKGSMDYSLLTIYLQENHKKFIKFDKKKYRYYSNDMITVNFDYSYESEGLKNDERYKTNIKNLDILKIEKLPYKKQKNSIKSKIRRLKKKEKIDVEKINELKIKLTKVNNKIDEFKEKIKHIEEMIEIIKINYNTNTQQLREKLYTNGFTLNVNGVETKYIRLYRSSGSARNGKVNFVNEKYYNDIIEYCMAGIEYKEKNNLDLPSIEAYISLIATSITDTFELSPKNVLLIDDIESTFKDTVMATELINEKYDDKGNIISGDLHTDVAAKEITNKLSDGEALLDNEIFVNSCNGDKAIMQLRNRFYKGIGINTNIQQFFEDNNITDIKQLNGQTLATDIRDIKLITTKSSIKYLKDKTKTFEDWCEIALDTWGICKTDKGQHHNFNNMASTHYQLLNTLGLTYLEVKQFLQPTKDYIVLLKNDVSVFKLHLGLLKDGTLKEIFESEIDDDIDTEELEDFASNSEFVLNMLKINEDFINTTICKKFREEIINNYIKNVKKGHVLVDGTYSVVVNNPYEYLLASINQFDDVSETLQPNECYCKKYDVDEDILAVRSPQPTMSNVTVMKNKSNKLIDKYFNPTDNVIFISSIDWNIMELESSMDFDGDACLITNNKILCEKCKGLNEDITVNGKTIKRFLVSTDFTPKTKIDRSYSPKDLADTDIKCSEGKIGEVINLVQMLNSVYWNKKYKGATEKELLELYKDISNLNVLSCIVIDSAKKSSPVNVKCELDKIRAKGHLLEKTRPFFFKYLDGGKDYKWKKYHTGMDYLVTIMNKIDRKLENDKTIDLKSILVKQKMNEADRKKISKFTELVTQEQYEIAKIYQNDELENKEKYKQVQEVKADFKEKFNKTTLNKVTIYVIIKRLGKAIKVLDNNRKILNKQTKDLKKVHRYDEIKELKEQFNIDNKKHIQYVRIGRGMLRHLYELDSVLFLSCFIVKSNTNTIYRSENGDIDIYGIKYQRLG